jgi:hypothetical protein
MSSKDLSSGAGKGSEPSIKLPTGEGKNSIFKDDPIKEPAPWEALRPVAPKPDEPKPPSKIGIFFRKALRWTTGLIFVFGLGVVTAWFVRVQPQDLQIDDLNDRIQAAEATAEELESQVSTLLPLAVENESILAELSETQLHVDVMRVLVDVTSAEIALMKDDLVTAKASLTGTETRLELIHANLEGEEQQAIEGIQTRLTLVLEGIEEDTETALGDLDVLTNNLIALERSLFGN